MLRRSFYDFPFSNFLIIATIENISSFFELSNYLLQNEIKNMTITNFYKFVENIDGIDFYFQNNVLNFLNKYVDNMAFNAESLERDYIMYCDNYPFSGSYDNYYCDQDPYDYPAEYSKCFFYQYSFVNLVRTFTNATDHNETETKLIKSILEEADEERARIYRLTFDETPIEQERVDECLLGDDNVDFRDCYYLRLLLKDVKSDIQDLIDEGQIKTNKDLWTNWFNLIETYLIPKITNPVHLYEFWGYVVDNVYSDYDNYEVFEY